MDQDKIEKFRNEVRKFLAVQPLDQLSYILGRYCGPSNRLLSENRFGYIMPKDLVEKELATRSMEDALFGDTE